MNPALRAAYGATGTVVASVAHLARHVGGDAKVLRSLRARDGLLARYVAWGAAKRDRTRTLLWMHAPSVGEGLQGRPVLELLRARFPALQIAYTHYSPSAEPLARALRDAGLADFADYLPWDITRDVRVALEALAPSVLAFAKLDIWPVLVDAAAARGTKISVISATLREHSARQSRLGAAFLRDAYGRLNAVGAVAQADADRLRRLGVRPDALRVTGDTRYDQVWARARQIDRSAAPLAMLFAPRRPTVVAGSTWPGDERVILDGWRLLRDRYPAVRLVLVPHEPSPSHLAAVEQWVERHNVQAARISALAGPAAAVPDLVVVDRVGLLGALYAAADVAFVGGAFHRAGLHSVLEPAAFGIPVVFGPRYDASADAQRLLDAGGAAVVREAGDVADVVGRWIGETARREDAGRRALEVVRSGLGAAERSVAMLTTLMGSGAGDGT